MHSHCARVVLARSGAAAAALSPITAEFSPGASAFFLSWFTYAPNGAAAGAAGHRWYTAQGAFPAGMRTIPVKIYETIGGSFDTLTPSGQHTVEVGSGTMTFQRAVARAHLVNASAAFVAQGNPTVTSAV